MQKPMDVSGESREDLTFYGSDFEDGLEVVQFPHLSLYRAWHDDRKLDFAKRWQGKPDSTVIAALTVECVQGDAEITAFTESGDGHDMRAMNVVGRLTYIGALPLAANTDMPFGDDLADWMPRIVAAVGDKAQLHQPFNKLFEGSLMCYSALCSSNTPKDLVLASLAPLASRRKVVLSAIFALPNLLAMKGSYIDGVEWVSPSGSRYELVMCPIMKTPIFIRDHERLTAELRAMTSLDIVVVAGSMAMREVVMGLIATRKLTWTAEDGLRVDAFPKAPPYDGFMNSIRFMKRFQQLIGQLPGWSKLVPPPQSLTGSAKLPDYLHYLLDWVSQNGDKYPFTWPMESEVVRFYDDVVTPAVIQAFDSWRRFTDFSKFYETLKVNGSVPITGLGAASELAAKRRAIENTYALHTAMLGSSTANYRHVEPRHVNGIMKVSVIIDELRRMDVAPPVSVDYCGVGSAEAAKQLQVWNADVAIRSYGAVRHKSNTLDFSAWDLRGGYPGNSEILYDDSYDETSADMERMNSMKVEAALKKHYAAGVLKFYVGSGVKTTYQGDSVLFPYDWQRLFDHYRDVHLISPGRAHSPEVYILFAGRRVSPATTHDITMLSSRMVISSYFKAILMAVANLFRAVIFRYGYQTVLTPRIDDIMGHGLVSQCATNLGFGVYQDVGIYDWHDLGVVAEVVQHDVGIEKMPDLSSLIKNMQLVERRVAIDPEAAVRPEARKRRSVEMSVASPRAPATTPKRVRVDEREKHPEDVETRVLEHDD